MFATIPLLNVAISLILAIIGAFLGGLIATAIDEGLWENNSPPEQIQKEVREKHLEVIGNPGPEPISKRLFDYISALFGILLSMPIWSFITFLVWFEDPGPILFIKNAVTKGGNNFHQFKFRTMVLGAEVETGPVQAKRADARVLLSGRFLRKTALDELPQLINILRSEMSFVGPRPHRTVLVRGYLEVLPEFAERHRILPGLAGLAQVAGDYYLTPRQKLRFDRLYIRYRSLGFDLKLIMLAFLITFWYRWQDDWNGRLPRSLMRFGTNKPENKT
jgi:lipopolysaccharide/colanic/teichoic acid biosynthesis glycosyltransferase